MNCKPVVIGRAGGHAVQVSAGINFPHYNSVISIPNSAFIRLMAGSENEGRVAGVRTRSSGRGQVRVQLYGAGKGSCVTGKEPRDVTGCSVGTGCGGGRLVVVL